VEDELVVAMDMEMQLTSFGYDVTGIACSGEEAIQLSQRTQPDLILMDIQLHGSKDGFATAAEILHRRDLPIVFVTAFGHKEAQLRAEAASPYGFLKKPYGPEDLKTVVSSALKQYKSG
jgi:CheY-like chemotaxis protein